MNFTKVFDVDRRNLDSEKIYAIACTQRTGSTLLSHAFWATSVLGVPMSYFHPYTIGQIMKSNSIVTDLDYHSYIVERRASPNGVFGYKIQIGHLRGIRRATPYLYRRINTSDYIYLKRRNQVAQAISLYRAEMTGVYSTLQGKKGSEIVYDQEGIAGRLKRIVTQNRGWEKWFSDSGVGPLRLYYEDIKSDPDDVAKRWMAKLQIEPGTYFPMRELPRAVEKMGNATSEEWESRFRHEAQEQWREHFDC